ncbi:hypothetical protein PVL29_004818 [Vitis rotundifolia]|uniref:Uncharacterized protein n=1 Tax=Vitis rotundifolia TaxID=103349 RepID=A0AA39A9J6_VITRO|nr:hypothetical protein PVL29_004818 [Vitis rotundifolia]
MESKRESKFPESNAHSVFLAMPEGAIVDILKLTTPQDAYRLLAVASVFLSVAESDYLWESFLLPDYLEIVSQSSEPLSRCDFSSKKELFFSLCDSPLLIDEGRRVRSTIFSDEEDSSSINIILLKSHG